MQRRQQQVAMTMTRRRAGADQPLALADDDDTTVERRVDMIPSRLSTEVCSLHSDVDRLAVSVLWGVGEGATQGGEG